MKTKPEARRNNRLVFLFFMLLVGVFSGLWILGQAKAAALNNAARNLRAALWAKTSIWGDEGLPEVIDGGDPNAIEVGVKFRSHTKGWITSIRFYKASANTGVHVGTLWSEQGLKLASATFFDETSSGWQQVTFARPVGVEANAIYVASYHTNTGHYSADPLYFVAGGDNGTLQVLRDGVEGGNGVYSYGKRSEFPAQTRKGTNYWVDVVFVPARVPRGDTYLPWAGGSAYYRRWPNGPSPAADPGFFPIGVWDQSPSDAQGYRALGVNLYVALPRGPKRDQLSQLAAARMGLFVVGAQDRVSRMGGETGVIKAWGQIDEPDNAQDLPDGKCCGPCIFPSVIVDRYENFRANDSTRPVYLGVGKSVDNTVTRMRGVCTGHYGDYPVYLQGADIVSYDGYPVNTYLPLWYVAKGMDHLRAWVDYKKPAYEAIETTRISATEGKPSTGQVKSEVWMVIIHGGMGIIYFCHSFTPKMDAAAMLHDPAMSHEVAALDREITSLAPVLNTPSVSNGVRVASSNANTPIDVMLKRWNGSTYVFTVGARPGGPATATFALRDFPSSAPAVVLGENRQIEVKNGKFHDSFANHYQVHIYRIPFVPLSGKPSLAEDHSEPGALQ